MKVGVYLLGGGKDGASCRLLLRVHGGIPRRVCVSRDLNRLVIVTDNVMCQVCGVRGLTS